MRLYDFTILSGAIVTGIGWFCFWKPQHKNSFCCPSSKQRGLTTTSVVTTAKPEIGPTAINKRKLDIN
jgi:hypothetical protein